MPRSFTCAIAAAAAWLRISATGLTVAASPYHEMSSGSCQPKRLRSLPSVIWIVLTRKSPLSRRYTR